MIDRDLTQRLRKAADQFPAVTVTGPRRSGKSTLCQQLFPSGRTPTWRPRKPARSPSATRAPSWPIARSEVDRSPDQLRSHPLRGPLFETWVVSEIHKHRTNRGEPAGMSIYRDRDAAEADLILERPGGLTLVEAKASQTASTSLFDGTRRVRDHLATPSRPCDVVVAYGGDDPQSRSEGEFVPRDRLHEGRWAGEGR